MPTMTTNTCPCHYTYNDDHSSSCLWAGVYGGEAGIKGSDDRRERIAQRDRF